jgi:hypothetical protein
MTAVERIDAAMAGIRARSGGRSETEDVSRQNHPERETRPRHEKESHPDFYERTRAADGQDRASGWSGGWAAGQNQSAGRQR